MALFRLFNKLELLRGLSNKYCRDSLRPMKKTQFIMMFALMSAVKAYSFVPSNITPLAADETFIKDDLRKILNHAGLTSTSINIHLEKSETASNNVVKIECSENSIDFKVSAKPYEWGATTYLGLQKMGFLFPHPRIQISPTQEKMQKACGETFEWKPTFRFRGFHLHTMHPSEWVSGFLMGKEEIAKDLVRWLARNGQNIFDLNLLRQKKKTIYSNLKEPFALAKKLGVHPGVSLGAALHQQNSYKLLGLVRSLTGVGSVKRLKKNVVKLANNIDFDYFVMEAGTSEFTPVPYGKAMEWMEAAAEVLENRGKQLFIKVHVSTNQTHDRYGNFNFLPQYTNEDVGIFPHTVMFYGLYDQHVPMYGNDSFNHMLDFTEQEYKKRPTWYYPETSYFIGMDIDHPLFLTDYLTTRAVDMKNLAKLGLEGQANFTTGHENGYWLFDWNLALLANSEHEFSPYAGLDLLGEDRSVWEPILAFQTKYIKDGGLISIMSAPNFQDELTKGHRIHERNIVKELVQSPEKREEEILKLEEALKSIPKIYGIKNQELRLMMEVTLIRIEHALQTRMALRHPKKSPERASHLLKARDLRYEATNRMMMIYFKHNRYPDSKVFEKWDDNPTSYHYGYGYPARTLHFWKREEMQVEKEKFSPFFMNIYSVFDILL